MNKVPESEASVLPGLLNRLAVGADQALFSADDWAARLGTDADGQAFSEQLRREWYPISVPDPICQEMMDYARGYLMPYAGWPHLWAHILRVTGAALAFAPEAGVEQDHSFMLGIFHDLGKLNEMDGGEPHEAAGAKLFSEKLADEYWPKEIALLAGVIAKTSSPRNPYGQLLSDADKLDKIGATGIVRRFSISAGSMHFPLATLRIKQDIANFPAMHFRSSSKMADLKLEYSRQFIALMGI